VRAARQAQHGGTPASSTRSRTAERGNPTISASSRSSTPSTRSSSGIPKTAATSSAARSCFRPQLASCSARYRPLPA
jgi:hypothetical protein